MKIPQPTIESCRKLIAEARNIVITNHVNPDGDAMGSALGLKAILKSAGKESRVIVPNDYPDFLKWMEGSDEVLIFENEKNEATTLIEGADLIFRLDYNSLKRSGPMEDVLRAAKAKTIVIDHHQQPEDFEGILISEPQMSSTCEMMYHFAFNLSMGQYVNRPAAECFYTGIITDTGNFRFSSTTPQTHNVAGSLLEIGVEPHIIAARVYDTNTRNRLGLLSRTLESMEVITELHTVVMSLSSDDLKTYDYQKGDTEGFVNYGLSLKGIVLSVFLAEKDEVIKISFRSKGNFNVNAMARSLFNGGGHVNAAGAVSELGLKETIQKLKDALPAYNSELQNAI